MKRISLILLVTALTLGAETSFSCGFNKSVYEDTSSATGNLRNLNLLMSLTSVRKSTLKASTVVSQDSQKEITAGVETDYAVIYAYKEVEVRQFLIANLDRIFEMVASYFKLEVKDEKMVVWVEDFDTLQKLSPGQTCYPEGAPYTVACLYAPSFNYFFFTPGYMNDFYVTDALIHYFIDEHPDEVAAGLPQVIARHKVMGFRLQDFLRRHEEKICRELSLIIIRKSLASLALQGV